MEKRSSTKRSSSSSRVKLDKDESPKKVESKKEVKISNVRLKLLIDVNYKIKGNISNRDYEFYGAGYTAEVDERDVPHLLAKVYGGSCCGGDGSDKRVFELV